jgi:hypothetical protein
MKLVNEILTILWLKFKHYKTQKKYSAYLQIEVLIAVSILSISVAASVLGVSSYRKQCQRLLIQRHLSICTHNIAEHIEYIYPQWKASQTYSATNSSPLDFIILDQFTPYYTLEEIVNACSIEMPSIFSGREVFFVSGSKEIQFGDIRSEQVFFYCYTKFNDRWMYSCVMKSYAIN